MRSMKPMKKVFLCLTAALLAAAMLCSCAGGKTTRRTARTHAPSETGYIPGYSEDNSPTDTPAVNTEPTTADETSSPTEPASETPAVTETPTQTPQPTVPPEYNDLPDPGFLCEQCFVYDVDKGCFLYIKGNAYTIYPASTTKLLTILYARTLLPLDKVITPGNELEMVGPNSSVAYIKEHHRLTVEQLIEGMLLPSGNDAAHVLAAAGGYVLKPDAADGKEAVSVFMKGMNDYARSIGLVGSVFINPDGYDNPEHYSTLEDMAIVARNAYKDEIIRKYCCMPSDEVTYASGHIMNWSNTNWCIDPYSPDYYVPEMNGMKTGSVNRTYYCFIGSAEIEGSGYIFGFFGEKVSTDRFTDSKRAVQWIKSYIIH